MSSPKILTFPMMNTRKAFRNDLPFVYNSWLKSSRKDFPDLRDDEYFVMNTAKIDKILDRAEVKIACEPEDSAFYYGYIVYEFIDDFPVLHYGYTKASYRNFGIFTTLCQQTFPRFGEVPIATTHKLKRREYLNEKFNMVYKPDLLR